MRTFGIVFLPEGIKSFLLGLKILSRGNGSFFLEGTVHSFVLAILLRFAGFYLFGINAQLDPPDRKGGKSPDGTGSKGHPVVGPYSLWQAIVIEKPGNGVRLFGGVFWAPKWDVSSGPQRWPQQ